MIHANDASGELKGKQRDYLLLTIFVLGQHGRFDRAFALLDAMMTLGEKSPDVIQARAILSFFKNDYEHAIECLDRLQSLWPQNASATRQPSEAEKMQRYLRARCYFQIGREAEARAIAAEIVRKPQNGGKKNPQVYR